VLTGVPDGTRGARAPLARGAFIRSTILRQDQLPCSFAKAAFAKAATSVLFRTLSFFMMLRICAFTVASRMLRSPAICALRFPLRTASRTASSRLLTFDFLLRCCRITDMVRMCYTIKATATFKATAIYVANL
jgi:hypothetical protein